MRSRHRCIAVSTCCEHQDDRQRCDDGKQYATRPFLLPVAAGAHQQLVIESVTLNYEDYEYTGYIAYVAGRPPAPVVLVHHNYAGLKQFDIDQAAFLGSVGMWVWQ